MVTISPRWTPWPPGAAVVPRGVPRTAAVAEEAACPKGSKVGGSCLTVLAAASRLVMPSMSLAVACGNLTTTCSKAACMQSGSGQ